MTEVLTAGRGWGKSTNLLLWLIKNPEAIAVCRTVREADNLYRLAWDLGFGKVLERSRFLSTDQLYLMQGTERNRPVAFDNVELFVQDRLGFIPEYLTISGTPADRWTLTGERQSR